MEVEAVHIPRRLLAFRLTHSHKAGMADEGPRFWDLGFFVGCLVSGPLLGFGNCSFKVFGSPSEYQESRHAFSENAAEEARP